MNPFEDQNFREFLLSYEVSSPSVELVLNTKETMRMELLRPAPQPMLQEKWIFLLVGMALVMSLCLFYMLTIGTILNFVLPAYLIDVLHHTLYALTAAGGSILACALMMLFFKYFGIQRAEGRLGHM